MSAVLAAGLPYGKCDCIFREIPNLANCAVAHQEPKACQRHCLYANWSMLRGAYVVAVDDCMRFPMINIQVRTAVRDLRVLG